MPSVDLTKYAGQFLSDSGVPSLEFRASIVIGSGSVSFEMIRALSEHLPIMVMPRWVSVLAQPIGIQDLIGYLVQALDVPIKASEVVEIGGVDQLSYRELMKEYARLRNLQRVMLPVPVLTPWLSSLLLGFVTPLYARVGRKLIESIKHPTIVTATALASYLRCGHAAPRRLFDPRSRMRIANLPRPAGRIPCQQAAPPEVMGVISYVIGRLTTERNTLKPLLSWLSRLSRVLAAIRAGSGTFFVALARDP